MITDPQEQRIIPIHPRATALLRKVDPRLSPRSVVHHDAVQSVLLLALGARGQRSVVSLPDFSLEPLPGRIADGDVGEEVVPVIGD